MDTVRTSAPDLASAGWKTVWEDDFSGPAGTPPDPGRWKVITGKPWASGLESYADDPAHLSLDGEGHLRMTVTHTEADGYVSAWIETAREDFVPEPGGALKIESVVRTAPGL